MKKCGTWHGGKAEMSVSPGGGVGRDGESHTRHSATTMVDAQMGSWHRPRKQMGNGVAAAGTLLAGVCQWEGAADGDSSVICWWGQERGVCSAKLLQANKVSGA